MSDFNLKGILKGIVFSWILTFLSLFLVTAVSYFTDVNVKFVDLLVFIVLGVCVFISSFFVSKSTEIKKVFHGLLLGAGVLFIFIILSFFVNGGIIINSHFISISLICLICGFFGSVLAK